MKDINTISSLNDKSIQEFINLKSFHLEKENLICAQSEKVILKLLKTRYKIKKLLATPEFFLEHYSLIKNKSPEIILIEANKELLAKIIGFNHHKGVFALAEKPPFIPLDKLDNNVLVLNGLTSPENVGTLCRTASAFNINSLIFDKKSASPYLKRSIRVSMGNIFQLKVHLSNNLKDDLKALKGRDYRVIGTGNEAFSKPISTKYFHSKNALIIGSEGHGIDLEVKALCDTVLKIQVNETVKHLNAAAAGAIFLHEVSRSICPTKDY